MTLNHSDCNNSIMHNNYMKLTKTNKNSKYIILQQIIKLKYQI